MPAAPIHMCAVGDAEPTPNASKPLMSSQRLPKRGPSSAVKESGPREHSPQSGCCCAAPPRPDRSAPKKHRDVQCA